MPSCRLSASTTFRPRDLGSGPGSSTRKPPQLWKESLEQIRRIEPDVVSKGEVTLGLPGQVLTEMAEGASSLVVGSRGHGHLSSLILAQSRVRAPPCNLHDDTLFADAGR